MYISVLLIGGSGAIGAPILTELLTQRSKFVRIAALAANDAKTNHYASTGVKVVFGSFLDPAVYKGFNTVIATVGNSIMRLQPAIIEAAVSAGVTHFYPSDFGAGLMQPEIAGRRYFRDKQWMTTDFYGFDNEKKVAKLYGRPENRIDSTAIKDVARFTVGSLLTPFEGSKREMRVRGWSGGAAYLISALEQARGVKYDVEYFDEKGAAVKEEEARLAGDENAELGYSAVALPASGYSVVNGKGEGLDVDKFNFTPETLEETLSGMYKQ